uniref:Predicted protein n=1 Tax=Hordeum vulgare subsp. vulgare TaxID=112509 RepID=F2EIK2_HORVV|nr:predicted protein [Hordeum vulgare subsp. vulgare]
MDSRRVVLAGDLLGAARRRDVGSACAPWFWFAGRLVRSLVWGGGGGLPVKAELRLWPEQWMAAPSGTVPLLEASTLQPLPSHARHPSGETLDLLLRIGR